MNCKTCEAPIEFIRTRARRWMPVDANIKVTNEIERGPDLTWEDLLERLGPEVVTSHFATCAQAGEHRRGR